MPDRPLHDEWANSITHGIAALASVVGLVLLVVFAARRGTAWHVISFSIYGATLILLFTASTLYHAARNPRLKAHLHVLDHSSIYLLIAGTYTPFTLGVLRGGWGWGMFGAIWILALTGVILKIYFTGRGRIVSTLVYLFMGWLALLVIKPLLVYVRPMGIFWLLLGGVMYTVGVSFYLWRRVPFSHAIWHLFVFAGSLCHFICIMCYLLPHRS
jgi:hemolysin III